MTRKRLRPTAATRLARVADTEAFWGNELIHSRTKTIIDCILMQNFGVLYNWIYLWVVNNLNHNLNRKMLKPWNELWSESFIISRKKTAYFWFPVPHESERGRNVTHRGSACMNQASASGPPWPVRKVFEQGKNQRSFFYSNVNLKDTLSELASEQVLFEQGNRDMSHL